MTLRPQWLGRLGYGWAWRLQALRRDAVLAGRAPDTLWLLEHDPVVTTGRRDVDDLPAATALAAHGIALYRTERGGLATYHGPGQLVGYAIVDIGRRGLTVRGTVAAVEQGIIDWLVGRGVAAGRRDGFPGVWVGRDKIAAIGMHFRRGVSMHGFALNLQTDLEAFGLITPCGITDGGVTSLARILGGSPTPFEVADEVGRAVAIRLSRNALTPPGGMATRGPSRGGHASLGTLEGT